MVMSAAVTAEGMTATAKAVATATEAMSTAEAVATPKGAAVHGMAAEGRTAQVVAGKGLAA